VRAYEDEPGFLLNCVWGIGELLGRSRKIGSMLRKTVLAIIVIAVLVTSLLLIRRWLRDRSIPAPSLARSEPGSGETNERRHLPDGESSGRIGPQANRESGVICESQYLDSWTEPAFRSCKIEMRNGYPIPDLRCTPGGVNPSITVDVLRNRAFRTRTTRNCESSESMKHIAYGWYGIPKPRQNSGKNQVCELDHLVPLELGGSDGLGNIWPQCGPDSIALNERYFKIKDRVESYLADQVKSGRMSLPNAQRGIAQDWTQYIAQAN